LKGSGEFILMLSYSRCCYNIIDVVIIIILNEVDTADNSLASIDKKFKEVRTV